MSLNDSIKTLQTIYENTSNEQIKQYIKWYTLNIDELLKYSSNEYNKLHLEENLFNQVFCVVIPDKINNILPLFFIHIVFSFG